MAKNPIQALSWMMAAGRRLCTTAMATAEGSTSHKPLYRRLSAVGGDPNGSVAKTMDGWLQEGRMTTDSDLMKYVRELRKFKAHKQALELMDWMETRGTHMSASKHAVRLGLISKVKGIDSAESYFSSLPESAKNLLTYGALLNIYCYETKADKAISLYDKMKELNFASGTLVHNNLMTLYMKSRRPEKVHALFLEMKENNIPPDNFTYSMLMNSYASANDIDSVEKIIPMMEAGGLAIDWSTYANLAGIYNSASLFKKAESVLKKMEEVMDKRSREGFHFLISLYAGAGNLAEVNRVWESLKAAFMKTTNVGYHHMLVALSKLDDMDALKQCFEEWESVYVNYDMKLVNLMIATYLKKDMLNEAESLWKKATDKGFGSHFRTLELFMDYFLKRHEMDLALKCFDVASFNVKLDEWKPHKENLTAFLEYFEEVKDVDRAEAFCERLKKLECLDEGAYQALLRTYVAAGKKEPSLRERIQEDGIKMSYELEKLTEIVCATD